MHDTWSVAKPARHLVIQMQVFQCLQIDKESFSKEMNDDDSNLHSMTKLSGWPRYCAWCTLTSVQADS